MAIWRFNTIVFFVTSHRNTFGTGRMFWSQCKVFFFISRICRSLFGRLIWKLIVLLYNQYFLEESSCIVLIFMEKLCKILNSFGYVFFLMLVERFFLTRQFCPNVAIFYFFRKSRLFRVLPCEVGFFRFYSFIFIIFFTQYGKKTKEDKLLKEILQKFVFILVFWIQRHTVAN